MSPAFIVRTACAFSFSAIFNLLSGLRFDRKIDQELIRLTKFFDYFCWMVRAKKFILPGNEKAMPFSESPLKSPMVGIVRKFRLFVNNYYRRKAIG